MSKSPMNKAPAIKPEKRRFFIRLAAAMALYLVSLGLVTILVEERGLAGLPAYALVIVPGLCLAAIFWISTRLIVEEQDEFLRLLYVRQNILATGIALTAAAVWGFLEQYDLVEHIKAYWWPTIWCFATGIGAFYNHMTLGNLGRRS